MDYFIFSVRDVKSGFNQPWCDISYETAKRGFTYSMNAGDLTKAYPGDFQLYCLGKFNTRTGCIDAYEIPEYICDGPEVISND